LGGRIDAQGGLALARATAEIGEPLYLAQPPTGYADRAEVWVNSGALLARMNFALALASGRYPHVTVDLAPLVAGSDPRSPADVLDRLLGAIVRDHARPAARPARAAQRADPQITRLSSDDRGPASTDVAKLAALVIGSPEFQRRGAESVDDHATNIPENGRGRAGRLRRRASIPAADRPRRAGERQGARRRVPARGRGRT